MHGDCHAALHFTESDYHCYFIMTGTIAGLIVDTNFQILAAIPCLIFRCTTIAGHDDIIKSDVLKLWGTDIFLKS